MKTIYAVRYLPDVPLKERKHQFTGTFDTFLDAEDFRAAQPVAGLLEVERREVSA